MKATVCHKCNYSIDNRGIKYHLSRCNGSGPVRIGANDSRIKAYCKWCALDLEVLDSKDRANHVRWCNKDNQKLFSTPGNLLSCQFCNKEFIALSSHILYCNNNPNRIARHNQYTKAAALGLPKPFASEETRKTLSIKSRARKWTQEQKNAHAVRMKQAAKDNPESYSSSNRGRTKQIIVDGIKLQGQWEVEFYNWAKGNFIIERPTTGFLYIFDGTRSYYPDFFLPEKNLYIEIKGYETDKDRAKWIQFPFPLKIIRRKEISEIIKKSFDLEKVPYYNNIIPNTSNGTVRNQEILSWDV